MLSRLAPIIPVLLLSIAAVPGRSAAQEKADSPPAPPAAATAPPASAPPGQPPDATSTDGGQPDAGQPETPPVPTPAEVLRQQAKAARAVVKAKHLDEGVALLRDIVARADQEGLAAADRADLLDDYAWALHKAGKETESLEQQKLAVKLAPADASILMNLAWAHYRLDQYEQAISTAEQALKLGLPGEDATEARGLIKDSRSDRLHDRLEFYGWTAISFDSNILENQQYQTIANKFTHSALATQTTRSQSGNRQLLGSQVGQAIEDFANPNRPDLYASHVLSDYATPAASLSQWGLPLNIYLDLLGRLVGSPKIGLWLGYRFEQTFMLAAETDTAGMLPLADSYNFQQQTVTLRLSGKPRRWIDFSVRAEGFVNFSGLSQFTAFQGGVNAVMDLIFIESKQWRTRLLFTNNFRKSFDYADDGYLDGNKDIIQLSQELRRSLFRIKLGYQFTYDSTGVLTASSEVNFPLGMTQPQVGTYNYFAPLSYQGHRVLLSGRVNLPHHIYIKPSLHYEYEAYADQYYATYTAIAAALGTSKKTGMQLLSLSSAQVPALSSPIMPMQRRDNQIVAELGVSVDLPHDFALALTYTFLDNLSNIANSIDNRSYTKNTIELRATYLF